MPGTRLSRPGLLGPHQAYLRQRWDEGIHSTSRLHQELRARGCRGSLRPLRRLTAQLRHDTAIPAPPPAPAARKVASWILTPPGKLADADRAALAQITRSRHLSQSHRSVAVDTANRIRPGTAVEDGNAILDRVGARTRARPAPVLQPDPEGVIAMGATQRDLAGSLVAYRKAVEVAEAARLHAIAAALADHRRALEDIEAAYRRDVAAAQCRYSQRNGQRAARAV